MRCPQCAHENTPEAKFCSECGTKLELACPVCSTPYEPGAKFCSECGANLTDAPEAPDGPDDLARYVPEELLRKIRAAQAGETMRGERRTVTMLFADIQGSTAAAESLDPEEWAEIMNGAFGHLIEPVYRYEGTLARLQGDAILAFFGAPIAHEDDPVRAVRAGLEIVEALDPYRADVEQRFGIPIAVRVGINTGLVVVGEVGSDLRVEYTALGDAINVAARMEQTAEPGTVQVTDDTLRLLGSFFTTEAIGPVEVKGKADSVLAHRVLGLAATAESRSRTAVDVVGRAAEREKLVEVLSRVEDGVGWTCSIVGEAGIGKSTLLAAMYDEASDRLTISRKWDVEADLGWLFGRARAYERTIPHATFADVLSDWFGAGEGERFSDIADAVGHATGERDEDLAAYLATLVGAKLPDEQAKLIDSHSAPALNERTTESVATYLTAEANRRPIVLVLDDLHWADALTLSLIERLMEVTESAPLALVLVMRPAREDAAWRVIEVAARDYGHRNTAIELEALPGDATDELLASLLGSVRVADDLRQEILERSNGNPLFVEEIVRSLGDLPEASRSDRLLGAMQVKVPPSLTGLLTSRLDALDEPARHVAQVASVIGREFDSDLLAGVVHSNAGLDLQVRELIRRGILEERRRLPQAAYSFRHPLIRETAYSTVLLKTRRELHGRVARHLEARDPDAVQEIARHFVEASEPTSAFPYLIEAGKRATRLMALRDAIVYFMSALESPPTDADPDLMLAAHTGLGDAYGLVPDLSEASATYQQLLDYGEACGRPDIQVKALNQLAFSTAALAGDVDGALSYLSRARSLAEESGDEAGLAEYHMNACFVVALQGDAGAAADHDSEAVRISERLGNDAVRLVNLVRKSGNLIAALRFDEAEVAYHDGLETALVMNHEELIAVLHIDAGAALLVRDGDLAGALDLTRKHLPTIDRYSSFFAADCHHSMGEFLVLSGEFEAALSHYAETERASRINIQPAATCAGLAGQARVLALCGVTDGVDDLRERSMEMLVTPAAEFMSTSSWAHLADARLAAGDADGAREDFTAALGTSSISGQWEHPRLLLGLARTALMREDLTTAQEKLDAARAFITTHGLRIHEPELLVLDGWAAVAAGRDDDAATVLSEAVKSATESGRRPIRIEALGRLAALRSRAGEAEEATGLRERADSTIAELAGTIVDEKMRAAFVQKFTSAVDILVV